VKPASTKAEASISAVTNGVVRGPAAWKRDRPVYDRGNYHSYYNQNHRTEEDIRLSAIRERLGDDVFVEQEVLDIGCNAGLVSLAVAHKYGARRVVGVDVDADLIDSAIAKLGADREHSDHGCIVEFRAEDFLSSPLRRPPTLQPERFDIILCLSVTKWVHFAKGDEGIRKLFRRILRRLRPGGLFVLEPQNWASYKKKRHITREIRQTVAGIEMRPEMFGDFLAELGFECAGVIEPAEHGSKGFRRPLHLYRKQAKCAQQELEGADGEAAGLDGADQITGDNDADAGTGCDELVVNVATSNLAKRRRKSKCMHSTTGEDASIERAE